ncbi:MAG: nucleotidyl transferase AbiEii/AbiGii toxin family protein [Vicinamibacterales bacterium]
MSAAPESTRLLQALRHAADALDQVGVPWALVGGLAVSIRVEPRFTRDIDLAVAAPDDGVAESLVSHLQAKGFSQLSLDQQAMGRLAAVRLLPPGGGRRAW